LNVTRRWDWGWNSFLSCSHWFPFVSRWFLLVVCKLGWILWEPWKWLLEMFKLMNSERKNSAVYSSWIAYLSCWWWMKMVSCLGTSHQKFIILIIPVWGGFGIEENETHSWGLHSCSLSWHQQGNVVQVVSVQIKIDWPREIDCDDDVTPWSPRDTQMHDFRAVDRANCLSSESGKSKEKAWESWQICDQETTDPK